MGLKLTKQASETTKQGVIRTNSAHFHDFEK